MVHHSEQEGFPQRCRFGFVFVLSLLALTFPVVAQDTGSVVLARVDLVRPITELHAPVYACLSDAGGQAVALVLAGQDELERSGWAYTILAAGGQADDYVLVHWPRKSVPRPSPRFPALYDDGRSCVCRAADVSGDELADAGFVLRRLPARPLEFPGPAVAARREGMVKTGLLSYNVLIEDMISQVRTTNLYAYIAGLSGTNPAVTGGDLYTIQTRHTSKTVPVQKATQYAFQHLQALGLNVGFQSWSSGGYANRNVIGILPGGSLSNEIVLITAHVDDMPSGATAPGADDNASGSAGVLMAADVLRKYAFDRTIHFVLFTGEEQGLYGSDAYAAALSSAGATVAGVVNLDMIGWDSNDNGAISLYVRSSSWPGYLNDQALFAVFTNVVATYNMSGHVSASAVADTVGYSDHYSFWDHGYAAFSAIDDDGASENPYYHTTGDTLSTLNMNYITWIVKAAVGTVAHLAGPVRRAAFDLIQVDNGDWVSGSGVGVGTFYAKHQEGATETGADVYDAAWSSSVTNPNSQWLKMDTAPYAASLQTDARPTNSGTIFCGTLSAVKTNAGSFNCTNRLRFTYLASPESNRLYSVRVHINGVYAFHGSNFDCVTNLRQVVEGSGYISLPGLVGLTNGAIYGTCDIGSCPVVTDPTNFPMSIVAVSGGFVGVSMPAQVGSRVIDSVEGCTNLAAENGWVAAGAFTNYVPPNATNFDRGWQTLAPRVNSPFGTSDAVSLRFLRRWQTP